MKNKIITVQNININIKNLNKSEYISLTDIARSKNADEPKDVVKNTVSGTQNVGICRAGTQTCTSSGTWGACTGQVLPISGGWDDCGNGNEDCDSQTDEDCCRDVNIVRPNLADCNQVVSDKKSECIANGCSWGGPETCSSSGSSYGALVHCYR